MRNIIGRIFSGIANLFSYIFNSGIKLKYVLILIAIAIGASVGLTYSKMMNKVGGDEDYAEAMRYTELKKIVIEKFIDEVDSQSMTDSASAAIINGLGDKWSSYMSKDEYKTYQLYSANEYSDIGMSIVKNENGGYDVVSVNIGTPAAISGLNVGMTITDIDGTSIENSDIDEVRTLIRSKMNTSFELGINGGKTRLTVDCTAFYTSAVSSRLEKTQAGYIKITDFEAGSGKEAVDTIEDLVYNQKAVALCIDLRNNPGGLAAEAAVLMDYLLPAGEMFSLADKQGNKDVISSNNMSLQLPTVVLINEATYGEAEVFAAVMKEKGAAVLIGEATTGRTRIQETFELSDGSAARLSTKTYLTANGTDISREGGVTPDQIIHNTDPETVGTTEGTLENTASDGTGVTSNDEQLNAALKYLS